MTAYTAWIKESAGFIRGLDCNHLITVGIEGATPWPNYVNTDLRRDHADVDYATIHVWPQNWGWFSPKATPGSRNDLDHAWLESAKYIDAAIAEATALGKPLVVEEFGLARDGEQHRPGGATGQRDSFYLKLCRHLANKPEIVAGLNFWAWSGEGRPRGVDEQVVWARGDPLMGDPPHELQGWYGVYDTDESTHAVMSQCAQLLRS